MQTYIYHIATQADWEKAIDTGQYTVASIELEGFIHASFKEQLKATAERYYRGQEQLQLLKIDTDKLSAPLKVEFAPSVKQDFPHIYGALNLNAIIEKAEFSVPEEGDFDMPEL